jgi:hypothetical protein
MSDSKQGEAIKANRQPLAAELVRRHAGDAATVEPTFEERLQ